MKRSISFILIFFIAYCKIHAQATFQKYLTAPGNQEAFKAINTFDGNIVICGYTSSGSKDALILKLTNSGSVIWCKQLNLTSDQIFQSVIQTSDSGYAACGYGFNSDKNLFVAKFDKNGNLSWSKVVSSSNGDDQYMDLVEASDGDIVCTGYLYSGFARDVRIDKYTPTGQLTWSKTFGGGNNDGSFSICKLSNNTIMAACYTYNWGNGLHDAMLINIDNSGAILSEKTLGDYADEGADNITITANGNIFITAETHSFSTGLDDVYAMELNQSLGTVWSKKYGKSGKLYRSFGGQQTSDGGFVFDIHDYSASQKDFGLIKTDNSGNVQWSNYYGKNNAEEQAYDVIQTIDNGFLIVGHAVSSFGNKEIFIVKTDSLGNSGSNCFQPPTNIITTTYSPTLDFAYPSYNSFLIPQALSGSVQTLSILDSTLCGLTPPIVSNFASSDTQWCDKNSIDFYDLSLNNPTSWNWTFSGGNPSSSTLQNPTGIYYANYGTFDVQLIACIGLDCDTMLKQGFVSEFQNPPIPTVTLVNNTLYCSPAFSFAWYNVNNPSLVLSQFPYYTPTIQGDYFVIITDSLGCSTASASVFVTGLNESININNSVKVFIGDNQLSILSNENLQNVKVNIYDIEGKVIRELSFQNIFAGEKIQQSIFLLSGTYFVSIATKEKQMWAKVVMY